MTEQQDVLEPKRRRRRGNIILLGAIPVAVALTALLTAGTWAPIPTESDLAEGVAASTIAAPEPMSSIVAPGAIADAAVTAQLITVTLATPDKPAVKMVPTKASPSKKATSSAKKATPKKKAPAKKKATPKKKAALSYKAYCANPKSPYSASGGPKALLSAANKERARLGMKKLSWSSSLAGSATKWSKAMAAKDSGTKANADALSHNPNRPGAENVAVSYVSSGLSQGGAIARAHKNWMYSNGHCLNIMNPAYSTMGAGAAATTDGNTWYSTENFR